MVMVEGQAGKIVAAAAAAAAAVVVVVTIDGACCWFAMRIQMSMMLALAPHEDQRELSLLIDAFPLSRRDALEACSLG